MNLGLTNIIATVATMTRAMVVAVALIIMSAGCSRTEEKVGALFTTEEYTVYPDSFVSNELLIAQRVDTLYIVDNGKDWNASRLAAREGDGMRMTGDDGLPVWLFNRATRSLSDRYDEFTAYDIYVAEGLLDAEGAARIVDERITTGRVAKMSSGIYRWPVLMSDATWGMAALTVSSMSDGGEGEEARAKALKELVERDIETVFNRDEGLFRGIPMEMSVDQLPTWADAGDASEMMTLGGNVARLGAMQYVDRVMPGSFDEKQIDELKDKIVKRYWLPEEGILSQTLYQTPYPEAVVATDNLAQATAIVTNSVDNVIAQRVVRNTPMSETGVTMTWPEMGVKGERRELLTTAMWAIAAAQVKNYAAWAHSYGCLAGKSVSDEYALRLFQGVTLRTVIGATPETDGLRFHPLIHEALGSYHRVTGLKYRNSKLNVTITGKGDVIATFTIDGELMPEAMVPKTLEGEHEVEIVLSGCSNVPNGITTEKDKKEEKETGTKYRIHINGAIEEEIAEEYIPREYGEVTAIGIEKIGGNEGELYASKNQLYIPKGDSVAIDCKRVATTGGRVLAKKDLAAKHVETTRYKNSKLEFEYNTAEGGDYYVRLRYLDGLGIVNRNRQYGLRLLRVNGESEGLLVLPQRGPEKWTPLEDWSEMTGTTAPKLVELQPGKNKITVEYYAPSEDSDFDHDGNIVIPVAIELIKR